MPNSLYAGDVLTLVRVLSDWDGAREGLRRAGDAETPTTLFVSVRVDADDLRPALAVQQALLLSFDAASAFVEATDEIRLSLDSAWVETVLRRRPVDLTIVDLQAGSFLARYSIDPRTESGRRRLLAIGTMAAFALHVVFPPAVAGMIVIDLAVGLNDLASPDAEELDRPPLRTLDRADIRTAGVQVALVSDTARTEAAPPRAVHVYDLDLPAAGPAAKAFLDRVRAWPGVEQQSRFVTGAADGLQRARIWSSEALDPELLRHIAGAAGTTIISITKA
jgi:hypothetical protein